MSDLQKFNQAIEDEDFLHAFSEQFSQLESGNWEGLAEVLQEFGFDVSVEELIEEFSQGIPGAPQQTEMHRFLQALEDKDFERDFVHRFLEVKEGDWHGFARLVQDMGFKISAEELATAMHDSFFLGAGDHPHLGWDATFKPEGSQPR